MSLPLHPPLRLLHHVPGLVRHVLLLAGRYVNVCALSISMRLQLGRFGGVVMHLHIVHGQAGEVFDARFEVVGQAGFVGFALDGVEFALEQFFFFGFAHALQGFEFALKQFFFFGFSHALHGFEFALKQFFLQISFLLYGSLHFQLHCHL